MNCQEFEQRIDDYVDGGLTGEAPREAEQHLARCAGCREAVHSLRTLLTSAAELPRSIEPPRDLFPAIRSAVERPAGRGPRPTVWLALAASLLVAITAGIVGLVSRNGGPVPDLPPAEPAGTILAANDDTLAEFRAAEQEYLRATRQLIEAIDAQRGGLPADTAAVLDENLTIIDQAIDQVRETLKAQPENTRNGQLLTALYRQRLQLLRRASRLSS